MWRELFTRASSARGSASKQLAPQLWLQLIIKDHNSLLQSDLRMRNMNLRVLLIEDEVGLVVALTDRLQSEGYQVETAVDGQTGLARALGEPFDLIILDVMLPQKNGFDICRDMRGQGIKTPLLMLTARGQVVDRVLGLKLGADDYLVKPFEPIELLARMEALLRRVPASPPIPALD